MRISLDQFSFETPAGFTDVTNYTFPGRTAGQYLSVSFGARPAAATNLRALLANSKANLDIMAPDGVTMGEESDTRMDGLPARMLTFTFKDQEAEYRGFWAVALPMPETYVQISFVTLASDAGAAGRFRHILQSVVPARRKTPAVSPPRYVRRWVQRMTLDVPASLAPPSEFNFVSPDGAMRLALSSFNPTDPASRPPVVQELMLKETRKGAAVSDSESHSVSVPAGPASITGFVLSRHTLDGDRQEAFRYADLGLGAALTARVVLRGPATSAAQIDGILSAFLEGIRLPE
jgi:hypothetical protein